MDTATKCHADDGIEIISVSKIELGILLDEKALDDLGEAGRFEPKHHPGPGIADRKRIQHKECEGKLITGHAEAMGRARSLRRQYDVPAEAYFCRFCGGWHVGRSFRGH